MNDSVFNRFEDLQKRLTELRESADCEKNGSDELIEHILGDLQRVLDELRVVEEELRIQSDELMVARKMGDEQRRRYTELFDLSPGGHLVTDMSYNIREANEAACSMFQVNREFLLGKPLISLIVNKQRKDFEARLSQIGDVAKIVNWKIAFKGPNQTEPIQTSLTVALIRDEKDRPSGIRWLIQPIERKKTA